MTTENVKLTNDENAPAEIVKEFCEFMSSNPCYPQSNGDIFSLVRNHFHDKYAGTPSAAHINNIIHATVIKYVEDYGYITLVNPIDNPQNSDLSICNFVCNTMTETFLSNYFVEG